MQKVAHGETDCGTDAHTEGDILDGDTERCAGGHADPDPGPDADLTVSCHF
jgi:hypothetical protein